MNIISFTGRKVETLESLEDEDGKTWWVCKGDVVERQFSRTPRWYGLFRTRRFLDLQSRRSKGDEGNHREVPFGENDRLGNTHLHVARKGRQTLWIWPWDHQHRTRRNEYSLSWSKGESRKHIKGLSDDERQDWAIPPRRWTMARRRKQSRPDNREKRSWIDGVIGGWYWYSIVNFEIGRVYWRTWRVTSVLKFKTLTARVVLNFRGNNFDSQITTPLSSWSWSDCRFSFPFIRP